MESAQRWSWRSTGAILCARCLPGKGNSLPHVARLIDEYVIESLDERVLTTACELGASPRDLEFVLSRTTPNWSEVVEAAARGGHVHVFRWMRERQHDRGPWEEDLYSAIDEAACYGHLELIKWLHERGLSCICLYVLPNAVRNGHLAVAKWLVLNGASLTSFDLGRAARNGHLAMAHWIYENSKETDTTSAMAGAARNGDLEMLQWLHQLNSCSSACSTKVIDEAVRGGHFRVVEWLFENCNKGCSRHAAWEAANAGNLPLLQWLHEHYSAQFDPDVMDIAASQGHLEMVKWLHEQRSEECTANAIYWAAKNGHLDVVRWLLRNRSEGCTTRAMDWAAASGHLEIVKWLHEHRSEGCTDEATYEAARNGHADVLRWLVEYYPDKCRDNLMEIAGREGHLEVVQYLDENTKQRASAWGLAAAARQGWLETLLMLIQKENHYQGVWCGSGVVCKVFDKILTQLSSQHATPASSLWREALDSLERVHSCGLLWCVSVMLDQELRRGFLALAQQFMGHRGADEKRKYVAVAADYGNVALLRWLLEAGAPIDMHAVIEVGVHRSFGEYFEVAGYLSEGDRVQLVCEAVTWNWRKLLRWTLENTVFNDASSRATICTAFEHAPSDIVEWLRENLTNVEACKWCVASHKRQRVE